MIREQARPRRRGAEGGRRARFAVGLIAAALAGVAGCHGGAAPHKAPAAPVRIAVASLVDAPQVVQASGIVEPLHTVAVTTQVSGTLQQVAFNEGDFVTAGEMLFRIDPRPLQAAVDQARATLARDEAQANAGAKDDVRYRTLANMGYVSRSQADQMHATALAQAATVNADRAQLRAAQVNLGFATIRAPIAGRTGSLLVRVGNNVSPSSGPLVIINQLSPVLVRFPVLEQDFAQMERAVAVHPLHVSAVSSDSTGATDEGELTFLDNAVDSLTGTVTGKARFENPGRRLWPGELVYLRVEVNVERDVIAVPSDAVLVGQQGPYVFVVDARNVAQMQAVVPGMQTGDLTVIDRGLAAGTRVVIDGQSRLSPGSHVAILPSGRDTAGVQLGANGQPSAGGSAAGSLSTVRPGTPGTPASGSLPGGAAGGAPGEVSAGATRGGAGAATPGAAGRTIAPAPSSATVTGTNATTSATSGSAPAAAPIVPAPSVPTSATPQASSTGRGGTSPTTSGAARGATPARPPTTTPIRP